MINIKMKWEQAMPILIESIRSGDNAKWAVETLYDLARIADASDRPKRNYTRRVTKVHKKECPECGKTFRGNKGVGIHRLKAHGIGRNTKDEPTKVPVSFFN